MTMTKLELLMTYDGVYSLFEWYSRHGTIKLGAVFSFELFSRWFKGTYGCRLSATPLRDTRAMEPFSWRKWIQIERCSRCFTEHVKKLSPWIKFLVILNDEHITHIVTYRTEMNKKILSKQTKISFLRIILRKKNAAVLHWLYLHWTLHSGSFYRYRFKWFKCISLKEIWFSDDLRWYESRC